MPQQIAVLAYQFGDGFTNMIVPTSALVMGALALGKVPYAAWVRFVGPLLLKIFALAACIPGAVNAHRTGLRFLNRRRYAVRGSCA